MRDAHRPFLGAGRQLGPHQSPEELSFPASPPGTHPRLSLSEAAGLPSLLASSVPPPGRRWSHSSQPRALARILTQTHGSGRTRVGKHPPPCAASWDPLKDPPSVCHLASHTGPQLLSPWPWAGGEAAAHLACPICPQWGWVARTPQRPQTGPGSTSRPLYPPRPSLPPLACPLLATANGADLSCCRKVLGRRKEMSFNT